MAPPKGPKNSQLGAKVQIERMIQASQDEKNKKHKGKVTPYGPAPKKPVAKPAPALRKVYERDGAPDIKVQLPNPLAYPQARGKGNALIIRVKAEPIAPLTESSGSASPLHIQAGKKNVPVWLPDTKPFPFMKLPGELRNKVYGYFFQRHHFKIKYLAKGTRALTYILPDRPRCEDPKVPLSAGLRRRQHDYPRRVRSNEKDVPPFELMPGPCALLLAHPTIGREAAPLFYELQTFSFSSCRVLNTFMDMLAPSSKQAIMDVRISHYTAGYPRLNYIPYAHEPTKENRYYDTGVFKVKNDNLWEETLWRFSEEFCNLKKLTINEVINEIPMEIKADAIWRIPLSMALAEMKLEEVNMNLHSFHADSAVLEVEAYLLEQELLSEPYRDSCNAVENVSDSERPVRLLPEKKKATANILRLVMPGHERPAY